MDKDTRKPPTHVTVNTPGEEEKRTAETLKTKERPQGTAEKQGKRPKKKKRRVLTPEERRRRGLRRLGVIVLVILAFITAVLAWNHFHPAPVSSEDFTQQSPDVPLYVLVIGTDEENPTQTNFVGLAAVNKDKKTIDFIMLPDNTRIEGRKEKGAQALSEIYSEGGLSLTRAVVEDIFKIPVPYYVSFTSSSFAHFIDTMGGMPLYVEKDMYHEDADGKADIALAQGYQVLDGNEAAGYLRYTDSDGSLGRAMRQERFVKVFYENLENHFGITNAINVYRVWNTVDSNISAKDMARLAWSFRNVPVDNIHFYMLPGEALKTPDAAKGKNGATLWTYDPVEVQKIIGTTNNAIANSN
ncbi:LCP family protein [Megasphaera hominis]|jgi:LCP family protein required for cell wall assembly|uniref:LCP family protein n=1 Tax=Megasphaera hominis TaxID=159836 RepID=UPI001FE49B68|nr:LCP family protein [Megasphaera hominis]